MKQKRYTVSNAAIVKSLMPLRKITQGTLGLVASMDQSVVSRVINGKVSVSQRDAMLMSYMLGVPLAFIFQEKRES